MGKVFFSYNLQINIRNLKKLLFLSPSARKKEKKEVREMGSQSIGFGSFLCADLYPPV